MESHFNFKNFGDQSGNDSEMKLSGTSSLARQPSIYALTFDEFQNTWGGSLGKDFGSMNMDELLKSIWTAEETQAMTNSFGIGDASTSGGNLQRQGSLTLPRTISQKTVDEVWRDLSKEVNGGTNTQVENNGTGTNVPQKQPTLGEVTLEEFLSRAGVVREDYQLMGKPNNVGIFGDFSQLNNANLGLAFPHSNNNNGILGTRVAENNGKLAANQPPILATNAGGGRSTLQLPQQQTQQQQPLVPKPVTLSFASSTAPFASPGAKSPVLGIADPSMETNITSAGGIDITGWGTAGAAVSTRSPVSHKLPSVASKSNADNSSLSPVPYVFGPGRKSNASLEKVIERRQKRMIKNRESAARSRARKQAYTLELEAEIAKLKEMNQELQQKQAEIIEMQKNQILETMNKRTCLRRTLTANW